jgi:hypothetical protein
MYYLNKNFKIHGNIAFDKFKDVIRKHNLLLNNSNVYHIFKYEHKNQIYIKIDLMQYLKLSKPTKDYCITCQKPATKVCNDCKLIRYYNLQNTKNFVNII